MVEEGQIQTGERGEVKVKCARPMALTRITSLVQRSISGRLTWPLLSKRSAHTPLLRAILHNALSAFTSSLVHLPLAAVHPGRSGLCPSTSRCPVQLIPLPTVISLLQRIFVLAVGTTVRTCIVHKFWAPASCCLLLCVSRHVSALC